MALNRSPRRRSGGRPIPRLVLFLSTIVVLAGAPGEAGAATDCFPDRVVSLEIGFVSAPPAFNSWQPGMLLGPPGNATPTTGSLSVVSLGHGGAVTLEFSDTEIIDGPGPDFIVFENAFFCSAPPLTAGDPYSIFAEPGIVAVSDNGIDFFTFPFDATALSQVSALCTDRTLVESLTGLIGITPSFTGDYRVPDDPLVFDPAAPGGVSGHGGDAFDLAAVGLQRARFVRITDPDLTLGIPGPSEGLDLDAVVAIHARPTPGAATTDGDGDGLGDLEEINLYLTDPQDPDTDGDLVWDGDEVAGCSDPRGGGGGPFFLPRITLEISDPSPTLLRWSTLGPGLLYDAIRADVAALNSIGGLVDLGVAVCLEDDSTDLTTRGFEDPDVPSPGAAFLYLARQDSPVGGLGYGYSDGFEPRTVASGDCP